MADNIDTHIEFNNINADALKALTQLFDDAPEYGSGHKHLDYVMMKVFGISDPEAFDADERMGSKWVYIEDSNFEKDDCYVRLVSAWDPPLKAARLLFIHLMQFDKDLIVSLRHDNGGRDWRHVTVEMPHVQCPRSRCARGSRPKNCRSTWRDLVALEGHVLLPSPCRSYAFAQYNARQPGGAGPLFRRLQQRCGHAGHDQARGAASILSIEHENL